MPFGPFKNFDHCIRVVSHRKNPPSDPAAYCAWIRRKIEGGDSHIMELLAAGKLDETIELYCEWDWNNPMEDAEKKLVVKKLLTKEDAKEILENPSRLGDWDRAQLIDDHRWCHLWEKALKDKKNLFLTKQELRKLHNLIVEEMAKRAFDTGKEHKTPIDASILELSAPTFARRPVLLDPEFISFVGSAVLKEDPADIDLMLKCPPNEHYKKMLLETLDSGLREKLDLVWESSGPGGPYVPAYELWAIPTKALNLKEPKFEISPLSPILPATPSQRLSDPRELFEDSYYVEPCEGMRVTIHRKEDVIMGFDKDLEEVDLPEPISTELSKIEDPTTFILDGFIVREDGAPVFRAIDMPWWRESQHTRQPAEIRRHFLYKLPESEHVKRSKSKYFSNRKDAIDFLEGENGPYLLIPGLAPYPNDGKAQWLLYDPEETYKLAEGADAQIKELVDSGKWESKAAAARFNLMTKRQRIEPGYPYAQLKTTKKGYSQKEVFGIKSVGDLAKDLFTVPSKQSTEVKIDGFRVQAHRNGDQVRLFTESGHEITENIPGVAESVKTIPAKSFVLDTEATPYGEDLTNLGRQGAVPAFAVGATKAVDDSRWALHVFDILYIDGEDIHNLSYEDRRKRLRGLELPIRDVPKSMDSFRTKLWENNVNWATSAEQMIKFAEEVSKVSGSEGAMFKEADSKYRLTGSTPLWSKMKTSFEIDALVVGVRKEGGTHTYLGAIGPVTPPKGAKLETVPVDIKNYGAFVKHKGKVYTIVGKTFNTKIVADVGDIIRVTMKNVGKISDQVFHWFHPQVLEKREDKTSPDPLETAETIYKTSQQQQKTQAVSWDVVNGQIKIEGGVRKEAYLVSARLDMESPITCCRSPWIAVPDMESLGFVYLQNNENIWSQLKELGVERLVLSETEREIYEEAAENGIYLQLTHFPTIRDFAVGEVTLYSENPETKAEIRPAEFAAFYESIKDMPHECMTLSCGGVVPLKRLAPAENLYLTYPDEGQEWKYVIQFHIRGLSVHGDFRCQISKSQLVGWTWDLGKSLIKPMLKRTSPSLREKAGITAEDLQKPIKEISAKLNSSSEGRQLREAFSKKIEALDAKTIHQMLDELWKEEAETILEDSNKKILTQIKHPMSAAWLDYERNIPAGAVGATSELGGIMVIMDKGRCQFGAQKSYFHEYWLDGERIKNRRMIVRKLATRPEWGTKESFAWLTFFSKSGETPYTISRRALNQNWMPPSGTSALPQNVKVQIPKDRQYWRAKNAKAVRDQLVDDIGKRRTSLKLSPGLQFAVKRVWHKGPEVQRGLPVTRYWLLLYSGNKVLDAWDFGQDNDPLEGGAILARRRESKEMDQLLKETGELPSTHPASQTQKLKNSFDTSDSGSAQVTKDSEGQLHLKLSGRKLNGTFVFIKESGDMWTFSPASISEEKKAMLLQSASCSTMCERTGVLHLEAADMEINQVGELLFLKGPAIKPGEVLPMDGRPSYFTREGIAKFWPSMYRQPIVVLHGDLKGDVIGFVNKVWVDKKTGWGWVEGVIWHPQGIKLILEKKLPAFSIEVIPETVWDPEHKHEHVLGGECVGLAVVPKGACVTCIPTEVTFGKLDIKKGRIHKYGMTAEEYIGHQYWGMGKSTQEIADLVDKPRSTIESWMTTAGIPRRDLKDARHLRQFRESTTHKYGGRAFVTALGTGAFAGMPRDGCPQCEEWRRGGESRRNYTSTMFTVGNEHLLVNAPKGIATMLGQKKLKPRYVLIDHVHEDAIGGLHELRGIKPIVLTSKPIWDYFRRHYRALSGQKEDFDKLYDFERRVLPIDKTVKLGGFTVEPTMVAHTSEGQPSALAFKINVSGTTVFHVSDVFNIPHREKNLKGVDVYIGDGAQLNRNIGDQHISMEEQIEWAKEADIPQIFFTQIGHIGKTHEELNNTLKEIAPNIQALHDGAELQLNPGNPGARFAPETAARIASGESKIIVRNKPYQEYAKQAIYLLGGDMVFGFYVEGFPEGPLSAEKVRTEMRQEHGLNDEEWKQQFGDAKEVWVYHPRVLKKLDMPKEYRKPDYFIGPYIPNVKVNEG